MLPQEILMDIIIFLPAKSVCRFRCVSKIWRKLLAEPGFIRAHLDRTKHSTQNEVLLLRSYGYKSNTLYTARIDCELPGEIIFLATELAFAVKPKSLSTFIPSCDGLIILEDNDRLLLINPTTKEVRELPVPSHALDSFKLCAVCGLGYDHANDDYKIVSPSYYFTEDTLTMVVHVYSVRSGTWKEVDSALYELCAISKSTLKKVESFQYELGCSVSSSTGVFVGGSIHWLATNTSDQSSFIVGFNLTEEKLRIIPAPTSVHGTNLTYDSISELGGCLCVFEMMFRELIDIWVMKEYGVKQSWTKLSIGNGISSYEPELCIPGRWEVMMWKDLQTEDEDWVMYYVDSATFKSITVQPRVTNSFFIGSFRETLVSPYYNHDARSRRS